MKVTPRQGLARVQQLFVCQIFNKPINPNVDLRKQPYRWSRLVLMWVAMFALAGLPPASAEVKSLDGTIKFDANFDGAPEAILNGTGFGLGTTTPSANLHVAGNAIVTGSMVVGSTSNSSGSHFHVSGTMGFLVQTVTGSTTLSGNSMVLADSSSGNITLSLPIASTVNGRMYTVKKTSNSFNVLISCSTSGFLLQLSASTMGYPYAEVFSDGTSWHLLRLSSSGCSYLGDTYMIVDVSGGPTATSYPVSYQATTPNLTGADNVQYKTNKIVMRYIPSGNFTMGSPVGEVGRGTDEGLHSVTLTQGFYLGVFELTQQQYGNVVASFSIGSQAFINSNNTMPIHNISYSNIRGAGSSGEAYDYPNSGNAVDSNRFMGLLRSKAALSFDLPTEAQWEYACRAGTVGALNNGAVDVSSSGNGIQDVNLKTLGWYDWNARNGGGGLVGSHGTREVGAKLPNSWGLFDMHGNVSELTLDWHVANYTSFLINPVGPSSGGYRVGRGGSYYDPARDCRSSNRAAWQPAGIWWTTGFRLALPVAQ